MRYTDPYPNLEIIKFDNYTGYEFKNNSSDKLIIVLEGSAYYSTLGKKTKTRWKNAGLGYLLLQGLQNEYTIFIPEKLNWQIGIDYFDDRDERVKYTFDNLLKNYVYIINSYLASNNYASIVLAGGSEGALLLPMVYQQLNNKNKVSLLVSISGGGLSLHEGFEILSVSNITPASWKRLYLHVIDLYKEPPYPDSLEEGFIGMTHRWWRSFVDVRPFDYYVNINIPVLFVHGEKDFRVSKESTKYVE
ncbi:MAG: hypothetical protein LBB89_00100, partial [Treponema sp.]|nr:hypothetical protein [Treponema sp.]